MEEAVEDTDKTGEEEITDLVVIIVLMTKGKFSTVLIW